MVALVRDGNTNAFEALYDRHHRTILSFCRHMLGGADEAEDAVQHTFIAAYNDLVSSRKPINLRAWLFAIARNRCLTILRARRDRAALDLGEPATDGLAAEVQRRQDLRDLVLDINHLPDDQRAALVLAEIGALSHDEIGTVIGVPRGKVKALVFQARESLLASRDARDTDCRDIREQLATVRGGALRRTTLRRHLRECEGCREYRREVERQRRRIAVILPVVPTIALREAIFGAAAGSGIAGGAAGGGLVGGGSLLKGLVGKSLVAAVVTALGTGTILIAHDLRLAPGPSRHARGAGALGSLRRGDSLLVTRGTVPPLIGTGDTAPSGGAVFATGDTSRGHATASTYSATGQLNRLVVGAAPSTSVATPGPGAPATAPGSTSGLGSAAPGAAAPVAPSPVLLTGSGHGEPGRGHGPGDGLGSSPGGTGGTGTSLQPGAPSGVGTGQGTGSGQGSPLGLSGKGGSGSPSGSGNTGGGSGSTSSNQGGDIGSGSSGAGPGSSSGSGTGTGSATGQGAGGGQGGGAHGAPSTTSTGSGSGVAAAGRSDAGRSGRGGRRGRSTLAPGARVLAHNPRGKAGVEGS